MLVIGGLCHWLLIYSVWTSFVDPRYVDWETILGAVILSVISTPIVVPVTGFVGLTLCRMIFLCLPFVTDDELPENTGQGD